ncbi:50S ribosomal protein L1 [Blochmannia endosymbiont of Camponotus sp. C-003]|uniref:50S ribosomal protein L1 n=1 Tax=unclassified Candidatus Blochmanniella TaxID=711328 RepID=UPI0020241A23|nr:MULTISPECIES: 50S ribosomal protein L1 [unclassified Candidatus Blochmannia]URJ23286.1 50S ribosomal protein L1 [Blochmannia endosymbiont of Camponotus sp. C-003]URJ28758.1 50S ribosomal protein L1 [Blochmannia endosymbiont of Camponotus sp. C-046]
MTDKLSKRMRMMQNCVDTSIQYNVLDGLKLLKKMKRVKFIESVDTAINLGIDARKSDQNIRNNVILPHGIGRNIHVAVFTQGDNIVSAKNAGADIAGLEDLYDQIKNKKYRPDVVIASPDVMNIVSKLGPILGPIGLMPSLKMGTVSHDIAESVKNVKLGQIRYKNDKNGIIHSTIGRINFDIIQLKENLEALIVSLKQSKPVLYRGTYIKKITIATTMSKSISIDQNSLCVTT